MFDKVYADLMVLVKSTELNKSMNTHYKELLEFFEIVKPIITPGF